MKHPILKLFGLIIISSLVLLGGCGACTPPVSLGQKAVQESFQDELHEGITCFYCQGTTKCRMCDGTGEFKEKKCSECSGSGKCPLCGTRHIIGKEVVEFRQTQGDFVPDASEPESKKRYLMNFTGKIKISYNDNSNRLEEIKGKITFQKIMPWEETDQKWKPVYTVIQEKDCLYCSGNGKCLTCKGAGKIGDGVACPACSETGKCKICQGTGIRKDW